MAQGKMSYLLLLVALYIAYVAYPLDLGVKFPSAFALEGRFLSGPRKPLHASVWSMASIAKEEGVIGDDASRHQWARTRFKKYTVHIVNGCQRATISGACHSIFDETGYECNVTKSNGGHVSLQVFDQIRDTEQTRCGSTQHCYYLLANNQVYFSDGVRNYTGGEAHWAYYN